MPNFAELANWQRAKTIAVECHRLARALSELGEQTFADFILKESLSLAGQATTKPKIEGARPPIEWNMMLRHANGLQSNLLIAVELGLLEQSDVASVLSQLEELSESIRATGKEAATSFREKMSSRMDFGNFFGGAFEE